MIFAIKEFILFSIQFCFIVSQQCANLNQCSCSISLNAFQAICDESNLVVYQQNILGSVQTSVDSIIINNLNIQSFPDNFCLFNHLKIIDLARNQIASNITGSTFSCFFELRYLNLSSNNIRFIEENAFDFNSKLIDLNLSFNRIEQIPLLLFKYKLNNLQYLYLQGNYLKEIDVWFFYLKQIKIVDLRFNNISKFKNEDNFRIDNEMIFSTLAQSELIDLRYNMIEGFNDDILRLYNVCNYTSYLFFIRLLYSLRIDENPLQCNCTTSFNFINFFVTLTLKNFLNNQNNIFNAKCTNSNYNGRSIFNFAVLNTDRDCLVNFAFSDANCPFVKPPSTFKIETTTATITEVTNAFVIPQNLLNEPDKKLNQTSLSSYNDAQIAGYIIGLLGFIFLFIFLIYFLCPIEILAICFDCVPFFYLICPCKSGIKRDKEFDLFISYNRINEDWVLKKLVPFIVENNLVENYTLHYDNGNKSNEVFGKYIRDKMNRSSCILFILSDAFLIKEWNNGEFRQHLRYLITQEKTRFVAVQMHDICDEEVDEYFTDKLQIPSFISIENDEYFFWKKLAYFLYTNRNIRSVQPITSIDYVPRPNDDINFESHNIKRPIIHMPEETSKNIVSKIESRFSKSRAYEKKRTKKKTNLKKNEFVMESSQENRYEINRINNDYFTKDEYVDSLILTK